MVSGCGKEVNPDPEPDTRHSVTLRVSDSSTRAIFDQYGAFHWQTGDKIGVSTSGSTGLSSLTLDHTTSGNVVTGSAPVWFNGEIDGEIGSYAVYPYSASHSISGQTLTYNLPSSYTYSSVDENYYTQGTNHTSTAPILRPGGRSRARMTNCPPNSNICAECCA